MKKIYAYYEPLQECDQKEELARSNAWKHTWQKQGWQCVMLNRSHASNNSLYVKFIRHLMDIGNKIPQEHASRFKKIIARYKRWCALRSAGGGWMSDYDVANIAFTPSVAEEFEKSGTIHVITGEPAYLFYVTPEHCQTAINKFMQSEFFKDNIMLFEAEILNVQDTINPTSNLLFHGERGSKTKKSEQMLEYC